MEKHAAKKKLYNSIAQPQNHTSEASSTLQNKAEVDAEAKNTQKSKKQMLKTVHL
jgi:hypothetical protein